MKTKAVRMYGSDDIRLETFELPEMKDDEILVKVISDSICMSTYKALKQGKKHKRVPNDIDVNPVILGHEFSGDIIKVGKKWQKEFKSGDKFAIQPALNYKGSMDSPGYSFRYYGGDMTYAIIPNEVMEINCLINYKGKAYFEASLAEPMSCVIGGYHAMYHIPPSTYDHVMDIKEGGNIAILGGCGPMGLGAIEYGINRDRRPKRMVVTDLSEERIKRAKEMISVEKARANGVELIYLNPSKVENPVEELMKLTDGKGYDDVFVYVPVKALAEQGDKILAHDGTLNFFAGPTEKEFEASMNLYNIHYAATKIIGSTGGNTSDMIESLDLTAKGIINPAIMLTHVGGLDSACSAIKNLPNIPGGKKIIYTHIDMPLTAITDFEKLGDLNPKFLELAKICKNNNYVWNYEAEKYLLENFTRKDE